jgi:uncharacterized protein (TIGR02246 family)
MSVRSPHEIHERFGEAFSSGDLPALVALYEPEAVLVAEPERTVTGHDAIREAYRGYLALRPKMKIETVAVFENDATALLHGRWDMQGTGPDGSAISMQGRNTEVLRRQPDGSWLFSIDNPFTPE